MNNIQFYTDEKEIFKQFIDNYFFYNKNNYQFKNELLTEYSICSPIEFIIRPECNQQCQYCYFTLYGKDLYPENERKTSQELVKNLQLFLQYLDNKKLLLPKLELFAGDLFYDNLIYQLFDTIYNYYYKIYNIELFYFNYLKENNELFKIIIPSNFSFVNNEEHLNKLIEWKNKFKAINVKILLSASVDGKYATDVRENKNDIDVDKYYNKILNAVYEMDAGIHAMISAESIDNAIKNYDWWIEQLDKYNTKLPHPHDFIPYFLEVRNDNCWTSEKIEKYIEFLQYMIQHRLKLCNNSIELLTSHLFNPKEEYLRLVNSDIINFSIKPDGNEESACAFTHFLHINLQNMSIVPCHRLTYYHFIGGKFIIENEQIIDLEPINPSGYIGLETMNFSFLPKCDNCPLNAICIKGCLGAQYESSGELLIPCQSVCNLLHAKYKTLITEYNNLGVFKEINKKHYFTFEQMLELKNICKYFNISLKLEDN